MKNAIIDNLLLEWSDEFKESLRKANSLCLALFSSDKKLVFATPVMKALFKGEPYKSLINPSFDKLISINSDNSLVFEGLLTIGDYNSNNTSIVANVYYKEGKLLIIGGTDTVQLLNQYASMHQLNHTINNLQRQLLKEKLTLKNTINQLNDTNLELQQVIATKDKFFSIIAHDLKSPFNSIIGFSNLLVENIKANNIEVITNYAEIIIQSSNKAMDLLMNLMEWSRSQTGRMNFNPEVFKIDEFIKATTQIFDNIARQKSICFENILPSNLFVFADKDMISTIFRNLIANAIKFTMPGGEINISAIENQNEIIFLISDTGIGISQNNIEKLFLIDQNCSTPGTNNETGTGLGLILCKEFVEKHGGKIWAESEEGIGSTFYFTLPYNAEANVKKADSEITNSNELDIDKKLKILIAEDDEISEMLIEVNIDHFCSEVLKAKTGTETVEICRNNPDIDLILMDILMPGLSGYEATRQIRQFNKEVVIIAQTAYGLSNDRDKAIEAGCNDYITKPIDNDLLNALIQKFCGK